MKSDFKEIIRLPEFERDLKKLKKKFPTLEEDLSILIKSSIILFHLEGIRQDIVEIPGLGLAPQKFFKVRKFASRSLKGKGAKTGLRLIYKYEVETKILDLIEIYFKGNKENEDRKRIVRNYKDSA